MLGVLYLILCIAVGFIFISLTLPKLFKFMDKSYTGKKINTASIYVIFPMSLIIGMLFMVWPTYIFAYLFRSHANSLTYANNIVLIAAVIFIAVGIFLQRRALIFNLEACVKNITRAELIVFGFVFLLVSLLMLVTFRIDGNKLCVGFTVYSDFATHLDMIRSFSHGNNFPTTYSHYAGLDIKYHFMFQFLVGNLEYLGLRLDMAFNIPSILCLLSVCMLLYSLALKLFNKRAVGYLAILFFLFRSGAAFFAYVSKIDGGIIEVIKKLYNNMDFIGETTNESWGLYNLNVYANQRHLAFGFSVVLIAILLMLPNVIKAMNRLGDSLSVKESFMGTFCTPESWLPKQYTIPVIVGIMLGLSSFFNGACVIGALLVLFFFALIADRKLEYLMVAVIAVILSLIQTNFFMDGNSMNLRFEPGYLASVKNIFGITKFTFLLLGILPIVIVASMLIVNKYYKWIAFAFITPILFAFTFQLTTDASVNHKYIMLGCMLIDVFVAAFACWLYKQTGFLAKLTAIIIIFALTITGIYDFTSVLKKNSPKGYTAVYDLDDPVTTWVMDNSNAQDIYLTSWVSLNNFTVGGAMLYYGWPYYAWSAGYDTAAREAEVKAMYEAGSAEELKALIQKNNIRFIVVDADVRTNDNYHVREDIIKSTYKRVFLLGEGLMATNIYDTREVLR